MKHDSTAPEVEEEVDAAAEVAEYLRTHDDFLLVSHVRPDGDCLGSTMGMYYALRAMGKRVHAYNPSPIPDRMKFIPGVETISQALPAAPIKTTVFLDCGDPKRVGPDFRAIGESINIDHHATNSQFGIINYVDTEATSVGEQVFLIMQELDAELTPDIATALFTSIVTDSGSFRYPNTSARTFEVASQLVQAGANPAEICAAIYETRAKQEVDLTARVLGRLNYELDDLMVWSELRWLDYAAVGGEAFEPEGLVSDMRSVNGVHVSILFHELEKGGMRAGIRGKGDVDCAWIAQQVGGGGHFNASGCYNDKEPYEVLRDRLLAIARAKIAETLM